MNTVNTMAVIDNKQNRSQGPLNIADNTFLFFMKLEECRVNLPNRNKLNMLKCYMAIDCIETLEQMFSSKTCGKICWMAERNYSESRMRSNYHCLKNVVMFFLVKLSRHMSKWE